MKIVCKAMIRQIGRVTTDLNNQAAEFRHRGHNPVCVAIVGINHAPFYVSWEGEAEWRTTGSGRHKHPIQEAPEIIRRLQQNVAPNYDELIILPFMATNDEPRTFKWLHPTAVKNEYGAALVRISQLYEKRF